MFEFNSLTAASMINLACCGNSDAFRPRRCCWPHWPAGAAGSPPRLRIIAASRCGRTFNSAVPVTNAVALAGSCSSSASTAAAASAACTKHMWSSRQSVGLQLLRRQSHLQPAKQFLRRLQLHTKLLEEHQRLCRSMQRRHVQPLRRTKGCLLISRRREAASLFAVVCRFSFHCF